MCAFIDLNSVNIDLFIIFNILIRTPCLKVYNEYDILHVHFNIIIFVESANIDLFYII